VPDDLTQAAELGYFRLAIQASILASSMSSGSGPWSSTAS
jgi:hypothetical protein